MNSKRNSNILQIKLMKEAINKRRKNDLANQSNCNLKKKSSFEVKNSVRHINKPII